jgi:acetyl-CoA carboxylase carboxyl transferase subunit beta
MASYASLGDLILAEPGAMIGFAGPRVIKDTTQAELPPGFQTAEFLLDRGLIDAIVPRTEMKQQLIEYLNFLAVRKKAAAAAAV